MTSARTIMVVTTRGNLEAMFEDDVSVPDVRAMITDGLSLYGTWCFPMCPNMGRVEAVIEPAQLVAVVEKRPLP